MSHVIGMTAPLMVGEAVFAFGDDDGDALAAQDEGKGHRAARTDG
jgi:hypothetical protein